MKIAFLKSRMSQKGGLEKYTLRLAQAFAAQDNHVTILTTGWDVSQPLPENVACINITSSHPLSFLHLLKFDSACRTYLENHPFDIVFGMDRNSSQSYLRAGNGVHASFLQRRKETQHWTKSLSFKVNPLHLCLLRLEREAFLDPHLKILFTNSYMVRDEVMKYYQVKSEKICVVHNGVEWNEMQAAFASWQVHQPEIMRVLNRKKGSYQLLFAGHNFHRKGLSFLLEGMKRLGRRDIQLSVVGKDKEQTLWLEKVYSMGLSDQVTFFGPQPTLKPFYQMADAIVTPSLYDPFANVTVEAMAMGLYVITSCYNGAKEILGKDAGIVIENILDSNGFADALQHALYFPKTKEQSESIRSGVQNLDFSSQLEKIVAATLQSTACCRIL